MEDVSSASTDISQASRNASSYPSYVMDITSKQETASPAKMNSLLSQANALIRNAHHGKLINARPVSLDSKLMKKESVNNLTLTALIPLTADAKNASQNSILTFLENARISLLTALQQICKLEHV